MPYTQSVLIAQPLHLQLSYYSIQTGRVGGSTCSVLVATVPHTGLSGGWHSLAWHGMACFGLFNFNLLTLGHACSNAMALVGRQLPRYRYMDPSTGKINPSLHHSIARTHLPNPVFSKVSIHHRYLTSSCCWPAWLFPPHVSCGLKSTCVHRTSCQGYGIGSAGEKRV